MNKKENKEKKDILNAEERKLIGRNGAGCRRGSQGCLL